MAVPELRERTLGELSQIQVRYWIGPSTRKDYLEILVIKYIGSYGFGSAGNSDAQFMYAMAKAGVAAFEPFGVIHDLSELSYEWGDMLETVFAVGPEDFDVSHVLENLARPIAVVVGPQCQEAVRTVLNGINSEEPIESIGNVFSSLESAWPLWMINSVDRLFRPNRTRGLVKATRNLSIGPGVAHSSRYCVELRPVRPNSLGEK